MYHKLQKGAILLADAHYPNHKKEEFLSFLEDIKTKKISTPQLILMGDIFDLLVGNSSYLKKRFSKEIALLEAIANNIEVLYLEGNHDFYLKPLFKKVQPIAIQNQPLFLENNQKTYALSHGDKYATSFAYKLYTKLIRNPFLLKLLPEIIAKKQLQKMQSKNICKKIKNFDTIIKEIKNFYKSDYIIEGHFHQGVVRDNYIALPSFACSLKYAIFDGEGIKLVNYSL